MTSPTSESAPALPPRPYVPPFVFEHYNAVSPADIPRAAIQGTLLEDYLTYAEDLCDSPPAYHIGAILAGAAAFLPDNVWIRPFGVKEPLNLYVLLLGRSGVDRKSQAVRVFQHMVATPIKSHSLRLNPPTEPVLLDGLEERVEQWVDPGYLSTVFLPTSQTTAEGLTDALKDGSSPTGLFCHAEFGAFLAETRDKSYQSGMRSTLLTHWDGGALDGWTRKGGKNYVSYFAPSLLGAVSPPLFEEHLEYKDLAGGFLSRFFLVSSYRAPDHRVAFTRDGRRMTAEEVERYESHLTAAGNSISSLIRQHRNYKGERPASFAKEDTQKARLIAETLHALRERLPQGEILFNEAAQALLHAYAAKCERALVGKKEVETSSQSRVAAMTARIAAILAALDWVRPKVREYVKQGRDEMLTALTDVFGDPTEDEIGSVDVDDAQYADFWRSLARGNHSPMRITSDGRREPVVPVRRARDHGEVIVTPGHVEVAMQITENLHAKSSVTITGQLAVRMSVEARFKRMVRRIVEHYTKYKSSCAVHEISDEMETDIGKVSKMVSTLVTEGVLLTTRKMRHNLVEISGTTRVVLAGHPYTAEILEAEEMRNASEEQDRLRRVGGVPEIPEPAADTPQGKVLEGAWEAQRSQQREEMDVEAARLLGKPKKRVRREEDISTTEWEVPGEDDEHNLTPLEEWTEESLVAAPDNLIPFPAASATPPHGDGWEPEEDDWPAPPDEDPHNLVPLEDDDWEADS